MHVCSPPGDYSWVRSISSNEFVAIRHSILSSSNSSARKHEIMSPRERRHAGGAVAVPAVKHKQQQLKPKKSAYHNQHSRNRTANIVPLSSFASLVLSQSAALKQSRHVSAVCCGKCSGGGTNAFFFRGSHWRHGVLMLEHGRKGSNDNSSSDRSCPRLGMETVTNSDYASLSSLCCARNSLSLTGSERCLFASSSEPE